MKQTSKNGLNHSCQSWPRNIMHHSQLIFNPLRIISSLMICPINVPPNTPANTPHPFSIYPVSHACSSYWIPQIRSATRRVTLHLCAFKHLWYFIWHTRRTDALMWQSVSAGFTCDGEIAKHNRQQQRLVSKLYSETINKASVNECCLNVEVVCGGKTAAMSENGTKRNSMMS